VHRVRKVIDAGTGEAYESGGTTGATLLTAKAVVSLDGKRRLREQYLGDLVDMEAATVARLGVSRKLPFMAIKAVSDEFDFDLPGMERFVTGDGKFREAAFGMYLAVRPQLWKAAGQMGRTSALAADALCRELESAIATCGVSG
jgi:adenosylhomocysteine nucleosidase